MLAYFKKHKIEILSLFLILTIGTYLRVTGIFTNSFAFTYDVGRDMLAVRNIVVNHRIPLIGQTTGLEGFFYGPWWYYILTIPFLLSGGGPQFVALFISLINILAIVLAFLLGKRIGGSFLALAFSAFISFSPFFIGVSSQIWNPNLIPFCVLLIMLMLSIVFDKKSHHPFLFLGIGITIALILDFEFVFGAIFAISVILFLLLFQRKNLVKRDYGMFFLGILLINLPRIAFELRHNFLMTKSIFSVFSGQHTSSASSGLLIFEKLRIFADLFRETFGSSQLGFFVFIIVTISLTLFYRKQKTQERTFTNFSLFVLGMFLIGSLFISRAIWGYYFIGLPLFYLLLTSLSFSVLQGKKILVLFILIILLNPMEIIKSYQRPLFEGDAAVYRNQLSVIDYIYSQANGDPFTYIAYTPPVHDYTYQYLFLWHGDKMYRYQPSSETQKLFFVIMEPDFQNPQRLIDWLKIREEDGKIVKEEIVKGGIKVQIRQHKR